MHVVLNNQIASPCRATAHRSHASDIARMIKAPVFPRQLMSPDAVDRAARPGIRVP